MSLNNVIIRTKEQLKVMNEHLREALYNKTRSSEPTPLIYQYLHNPKNEFIVDNDNTIGSIVNIRKNKNGDIVGDVNINSILKLANNYQGCIDNMMGLFNPDTSKFEIVAFVVYDKAAKELIDNKPKNAVKPGVIPFMSGVDPVTMKEVSETIMGEYKKLVDSEQIDKLLEERSDGSDVTGE